MPSARISTTFGLLAAVASLVTVAGCSPTPEPSDNRPPQLTLDVGSVETYVAGEDVVRIRASATDPDADDLTFSVDNKPERAEFQTFEQEALFTWRPIASDVTDGNSLRLTFEVEDTNGAVTDEVVRLEIRAGNGLPQFVNSSSQLYDVSSDKPLTFLVEVRDDDSSRVELEMPTKRAPKGAKFRQTGPEKGRFVWEPSPAQEQSRVHTVTFVADDMENDPVEQEVTIIFKNGDQDSGSGVPAPGEGCDRTQPIDSKPIGAQHTLDDYPIEATLSSAAAEIYEVASVVWTTDDPYNNPDVDFESRKLERNGTDLSGEIPNLQLASGNSETVFYAICALDKDAPQDSEDKIICAPDSLFHSFLAYSPDDDDCIDDEVSNGSKSDATPIPGDRWGHFRGCEGATDVHQFEVGPGEDVTAFVTYPLGQTVNLRVLDASGQTKNDALSFSKCLGVAAVEFTRDSSQSKATYYIEVTGKDIPYQTTLTRDTSSGGSCSADSREPNDSTADATEAGDDSSFDPVSICDDDVDVYATDLLKGDVLGVDVTFNHDDGNLDATLFAPSDSSKVGPDTSGTAESWTSDDDERIARTAKESGTFYTVIFSRGDSNQYGVSFDATCRSNDAFSRNHSRSQAALPQTQKYEDLKLCGGEPDWYERTVFDGQQISAILNVQKGAQIGDVEMTMHDDSGNQVKKASEVGGSLELDYTGQSSPKAQYFLRVSAPTDLLYSLEIQQ